MKKEAIKLSIAVALAIVLIVLIVFFPRNPNVWVSNNALQYGYNLDLETYKANIVGFFKHIWNEGSLGGTRYQFTSVEQELMRYFPKSLSVIVPAFFLSLLLGVLKGIFDYRNNRTKLNVFGNGTTWVFQSIPDFFLVIFVFFISLYYFPQLNLFSSSSWYQFLLPLFLVSIYPIMYVARLTCISLLNQDGEEYIQTARSKGLTKKQVLYNHMMKNSIFEIIPALPTIIIIIISNLLMVEYLTGFNGAAFRLFIALGGNQSVVYSSMRISYEAELIIGIVLCFMAVILIVHLIKMSLLYWLKRGSRNGA